MGTEPGACHHCHTGLCPVGITTQDEELIARLPVDEAADRVEGFLNSMTQELQMFARACGKNDVHDLEPEDLRAMTIEASAITGIPLVGHELRVPAGGVRRRRSCEAMAASGSSNGHNQRPSRCTISFLLRARTAARGRSTNSGYGGEVTVRADVVGGRTGAVPLPVLPRQRRRRRSGSGGSTPPAAGSGSRPSAIRATTP